MDTPSITKLSDSEFEVNNKTEVVNIVDLLAKIKDNDAAIQMSHDIIDHKTTENAELQAIVDAAEEAGVVIPEPVEIPEPVRFDSPEAYRASLNN